MNSLGLKQQLDQLKKTTEIIQALEEDINANDNWKTRELLLHLWGWDYEMFRLLDAAGKGKLKDIELKTIFDTLSPEEREARKGSFLFDFQEQNMSVMEWNDWILEQQKSLDFEQAKSKFMKMRKELIELMDEWITSNRDLEVLEFAVSLWQHDQHHLEIIGKSLEG